MHVDIEKSWKDLLSDQFDQDYFIELTNFVKQEFAKYRVFPPGKLIFNAFKQTPFDTVKVVILGQDPYHGYRQAHGLAFSVQEGIPIPPSLRNIFKEIESDIGRSTTENGDLTRWANQGVFLLNSTLTVRQGLAGSHQGKGWEIFTDEVIKTLSDNKENLVFLLWGNYARNKSKLINSKKHLILEAPHPSPFSAHNGFFGCKHFSKTNEYLTKNKIQNVEW